MEFGLFSLGKDDQTKILPMFSYMALLIDMIGSGLYVETS
jgi:hypothetical protein